MTFSTLTLCAALAHQTVGPQLEASIARSPYWPDWLRDDCAEFNVRWYAGSNVIDGDLDLTELFWDHAVAAVVVKGDLRVVGDILDRVTDEAPSTLVVDGKLQARSLVMGRAQVTVSSSARFERFAWLSGSLGQLSVEEVLTAPDVVVVDSNLDGKIQGRLHIWNRGLQPEATASETFHFDSFAELIEEGYKLDRDGWPKSGEPFELPDAIRENKARLRSSIIPKPAP